MITLEQWITSDGQYPARAKSPELTPTVKANAVELLKRVNALLDYLGVQNVKVSSGFRTAAANAATPGAAKRSNHMTGMAIDLKNITLHNLLTVEVLIKFDLYAEDFKWTRSWTHLQTRRTASGRRIFMP
jgi:hypothetical protein